MAMDMRASSPSLPKTSPAFFSFHVIPSSVDFRTRAGSFEQATPDGHHVAAYSVSGCDPSRTRSATKP